MRYFCKVEKPLDHFITRYRGLILFEMEIIYFNSHGKMLKINVYDDTTITLSWELLKACSTDPVPVVIFFLLYLGESEHEIFGRNEDFSSEFKCLAWYVHCCTKDLLPCSCWLDNQIAYPVLHTAHLKRKWDQLKHNGLSSELEWNKDKVGMHCHNHSLTLFRLLLNIHNESAETYDGNGLSGVQLGL